MHVCHSRERKKYPLPDTMNGHRRSACRDIAQLANFAVKSRHYCRCYLFIVFLLRYFRRDIADSVDAAAAAASGQYRQDAYTKETGRTGYDENAFSRISKVVDAEFPLETLDDVCVRECRVRVPTKMSKFRNFTLPTNTRSCRATIVGQRGFTESTFALSNAPTIIAEFRAGAHRRKRKPFRKPQLSLV